jgi:hypothetical protein
VVPRNFTPLCIGDRDVVLCTEDAPGRQRDHVFCFDNLLDEVLGLDIITDADSIRFIEAPCIKSPTRQHPLLPDTGRYAMH